MGLIEGLLGLVFGGGRNVVKETAEVFRENAEAGAERDLLRSSAALTQCAAEFSQSKRSWFDTFIDGLNRLPRPAMAIGTIGLFVVAMVDPVWFSARMQGIALVPEPLWWLMGAIVSFYFGARHQAKSQDFQRSIATTLSRTADVRREIAALDALQAGSTASERTKEDEAAEIEAEAVAPLHPNPALSDWRKGA